MKHQLLFYQFQFNSSHLITLFTISLAVLSYCVYTYLLNSSWIKKKMLARFTKDDSVIQYHIISKYAALLLLGIMPISLFLACFPGYSLKSFGITYNRNTVLHSLGYILALSVFIILLIRRTAAGRHIYAKYPQLSVVIWDIKLAFRYCVSWIVYLLGYEILFRGLLLFPLANSLDVWIAIAINTLLCMLIQQPRGKTAAILEIFLSPVLCIITLATGTIWAAWIIHCVLAITRSMTALINHPEYYIVRNRKPHKNQCDMGCDC